MGERGAIQAVVLGGTGYVAGEVLRLLASHPEMHVAAVASTSQVDGRVAACFPHLAGLLPDDLVFEGTAEVAGHFHRGEPVALFAATPHGSTATLLAGVLADAEAAGAKAHAVDLSADFRYASPAAFEAVYGRSHGAPQLCRSFVCAVPEHHTGAPPAHAAQPGCFTTVVTLAAFPFLALGLAEGGVFASAVTGSSGSGRSPVATTHHPERNGNMYAYAPLAHRHEPEMRALLAPACGGREPEVEFVAHSGPFVRGIHATLRLALTRPAPPAALVEAAGDFYRGCPFVTVSAEPPRLNEVVGTNRCRIGVTARGRTAVVTAVIDNLVKGAAGGAVQWMNRLFGLDETAGLRLAGLGWH
jgi:N-acetyl-gamma-glutamyl-phosphate reductase